MADAPTERRIGVARDYGELQGLLRARADELAVSRQALDQISGLQDGYVAKLLSAIPKKALGRTSFGPLLGALACKILLVEDPAQLEAIRGRLVKRHEKSVHVRPPQLSGLSPPVLAALMAQARAEVKPEVRAELIAEARRRQRRNGKTGNGHGHR
jgi:hypothetical protein